MFSQKSPQKQIWSVGGGKGGVGKSLISSSLAYTLARMGHRVVAIDVDLGGANLHTVLGLPPPAACISDFLTSRVTRLEDTLTPTPLQNLKIIAGAKDAIRITETHLDTLSHLRSAIHHLDADFIILDLGAGTSQYTLDFFNFADVGILSVLPEPTSIENAYRFLKSCYYNRLSQNSRFEAVTDLIQAAMTPNHPSGITSPSILLNEVYSRDPHLAQELKETIREFKPRVILNQTRSQADVDIGFSMKSVVKKYFGMDLDYLGHLEYEPNVWQSLRRLKPMVAEFPHSRLSISVERICSYLIKQVRTQNTLSNSL